MSGVQDAGLPPSSLCSLPVWAVLALWTEAWNPDLIQPPGPLSQAGSKLAESTHSQQASEPETAGDGGEVTGVGQTRGVECVGLCANPTLGRGTDSVVLGGGLSWFGKGRACGSQGLNWTACTMPEEGEQEGVVSYYLGTPTPREGKQLAKATEKPVVELAVQCLFPSLLF